MKRRNLAFLALGLVLLTVMGGGGALAQEATKQVGLVIGFPDGTRHAEIVTVPADATTFDVLSKANIVLLSTTQQFGPAVCSINKVGCDASNCFCDSKHFWAFYHLDAQTNKWVSAQEGVGSAKPANGAVEGLVWSGVDDKFNPTDQPPVLTFAQIQAQAGAAGTAAKPATLPTTGGAYTVYVLIAAGVCALGGLGLRALGHRSARGRRVTGGR